MTASRSCSRVSKVAWDSSKLERRLASLLASSFSSMSFLEIFCLAEFKDSTSIWTSAWRVNENTLSGNEYKSKPSNQSWVNTDRVFSWYIFWMDIWLYWSWYLLHVCSNVMSIGESLFSYQPKKKNITYWSCLRLVNFILYIVMNNNIIGASLCHVNCWENIPLVAEGKAEINPNVCTSMITYAFWGLIGFLYFQVLYLFIGLGLIVEK